MLGFVYVNSPSNILLASLAGTDHGLCCIFDMNNNYLWGRDP